MVGPQPEYPLMTDFVDSIHQWLNKYDEHSRRDGWILKWRLHGPYPGPPKYRHELSLLGSGFGTSDRFPGVYLDSLMAHVLAAAKHGSAMHQEAIDLLTKYRLLRAANLI